MNDPVQTKFGNCYERQVLAECFRKNGPKDPVSALPINPATDVYPNKALKLLIQNFLKRNPWAFQKAGDAPEDWRNIQFEL
jgi:hypothetical protein